MRAFWKRDREFSELEAELRARRAEPPTQFARALAGRLGGERSWVGPRARVVLAVGLVISAAAAVATTGGVGIAASGTGQLVQVVAELTGSPSPPTSVASSPANDQYKPGKGCGDKNHEHERRHQCKASTNDVRQREGNSGVTTFFFTISLSDTPIDTVTVVWTTANGTATTPSDYLAASGTATFAPGVQTQTISVSVVGDVVKEPNETFYVNLTSVSANAYIGDGQGVGTIMNDD